MSLIREHVEWVKYIKAIKDEACEDVFKGLPRQWGEIPTFFKLFIIKLFNP